MRKKLLALLMCATMVLGTGVTAFADSASDAKKVYGDNADLFIAEYYKPDEVITAKVYKKNDVSKSLTYGYDAATLKPVAVNGDKKPVYKIPGDLKKPVDYANPSATLTGSNLALNMNTVAQLLPAYTFSAVKASETEVYVLNGTTLETKKATALVYGDVLADAKKNKVATFSKKIDATTGNEYAVKPAASNKATPATATDYEYYVAYDANGIKLHDEYLEGGTVIISNPTFDACDLYVTNKVVDGITLLKGQTNILKSTSDYKVYTRLSKVTGIDDVLAEAIETKKLSKDAVALKIDVLQQTAGDVYTFTDKYTMPMNIKNVDSILDGAFSFDADTLSRTGLAGAAALDIYTVSDSTATSTLTGSQVRQLKAIKLGAAVGSTYEFASDSFVNHTIIIDKSTVESKDDAGQADADTTKPADTATTDTAKKMGDTAPIAALAVVMLGAFGAMVVASKKRA